MSAADAIATVKPPHPSRPSDLLTARSDPADIAARGGAKGEKLFLMTRAGLAVPPWAILASDLCARFLEQTGLVPVIAGYLANAVSADFAEIAERITAAIVSAPIDDVSVELVAAAHLHVGGGPVAVRSSASGEDGTGLSFAGQYASFLNVGGPTDIVEHVKKCWASAYSARCLAYRRGHGLPLEVEAIACIIQSMVDAEKSGVIFTANPMTADRGEIMISAVYGLGEGLVSGAIDADVYLIGHDDGILRRTLVGEKRDRLAAAAGQSSGLVVLPLGTALADRPCLTPEELLLLHAAARTIEDLFGRPQDIEWSVDAAGRLAILQARPITAQCAAPPTAECANPSAEIRIWENSNISESFGGITAPMTFSFARDVYHEVFKEYCRILGVPRAALADMDGWLRNMLGYHNGRVYYNLLNWYKVLRLAPTYRINWRMLEFSIGAQESISDALKRTIDPLAHLPRGMRRLVYARAAWRSFLYFFMIEGLVQRFLRDFGRLHRTYDTLDYAALPIDEIQRIFRTLRNRFIAQFGRMILLEQMVSLSVGALAALTKRWLPEAPVGFFLDMTRPRGELESLEPVRRMTALAELIARDPALSRLIENTEPAAIDAALRASHLPTAPKLLEEIDAYIAAFGYRCVNEMKLEEPDMREDPVVFFLMLKNNLGKSATVRTSAATANSEAYLRRHLSRPKRFIYALLRRKAQNLLAARERVRFCRTRVFGTARRMLKAIGVRLAEANVVERRDDIFFLRLDELIGWFDGLSPPDELASLIALRRGFSARHARLEAPGRFETAGIIMPRDYQRCGWGDEGAWCATAPSGDDILTGTPCCPGSATAEARLVTEPRDLGGGILVTYRTDPGWCPILPSAAALLIERGSPLTHVAIVARELQIPTIIQIKDLTKRVATGMTLAVDGSRGTVRILNMTAGRPVSGLTP